MLDSAPADLVFYYDWSLENHKQTLTLSNDILRQLLSLSAVLCGGSAFFLANSLMPLALLIIIGVTFLISMGAALLGVFPYDGRTDPEQPRQFQRFVEAALLYKTRMIRISGLGILSGLLLTIIGLVWQFASK